MNHNGILDVFELIDLIAGQPSGGWKIMSYCLWCWHVDESR